MGLRRPLDWGPVSALRSPAACYRDGISSGSIAGTNQAAAGHLTTCPKLPTLKANAATGGITHMTVTVKAGHKNGQDLEFRVSGGVITILPKLPAADDEYTSGQRRMIDARLAEGLADIKAGRTFGPFDNAGEMIAHMKAQFKKRGIAPKAKRSR